MAKDDFGSETAGSEVITVDFTQPPKRRKKENFISRLVYSALCLLIGLVFIAASHHIFDLLGYITGGMLLVTGAVTLTAFFVSRSGKSLLSLVGGILELLMGAFCIAKPKFIADIAVYFFAVIILISGVVMIYFSSADKRAGFSLWKAIMVFGIILTVLGVLMFLFVRQSQSVIAVAVGISFLISAVLNALALFLK